MPYKNTEINSESTVFQQPAKSSHFYKGFSSVDPTNSGARLYDFELIKQDIVNHFNTRKGERVMNPRFGSIIWDLLMEPLTEDIKYILNQDISEICNSDPRVTPTQISLIENDGGYIVEITLLLKGTNLSSSLRLSFDQTLGLTVQ